MKIEGRGGVIPFEKPKSVEKKSAAKESREPTPKAEDKISTALRNAIDGIEKSGLTGGEVHSNVDEQRAAGLLRSIDVEAKQPRMSDKDLLKLADSVSEKMTQDPQRAVNAFKDFDAKRVADLV
jgi:hypothetical protein